MSCPCCKGCATHIITYSYTNASLPGVHNDSDPPGQYFGPCPKAGVCQGEQPERSCCGGTIDGFIRSNDFAPCCKRPTATVFAGSRIDDYGSIAGVATAETCGILNAIATTFTTTPEIVEGDGGVYLKLPVKVTNSPQLCGPYGLAGVTVSWGWIDHTTCSQHSAPVGP